MKKIFALLLLSLLLCSAALAEPLSATSPTGAPSLALAMMAKEQPEQFTSIAADAIAAEFAGAKSDFLVAPINAGAKLFAAGKSTYRLAAVVTWGNLFFASQRPDFSAEAMNGQEVVLFGENTVNASVALAALAGNGIAPQTVSYLGSAANTQALLLSDASAIVLTAEPALSAAKMKNPAITAVAMNDLLLGATGMQGYAQAGLFVKGETAQTQPEAVAAFLAAAQASCETATLDPEALAKAAVALEILPNEKVALAAIPGCAIRYVAAPEAREAVEATAAIDLAQFGGALPADDFYYGAN